jgi:hypothetical protein
LKKTIYISSLLLLSIFISCNNYEFERIANLKSENHKEFEYESTDSIVEEWVKKDSIFLSKFKKAINENPKDILDILGVNSDKKENLGFGYNYVRASMGKGYASIWYTIVFKENEIVSYELKPDLPNHKSLMKRYLIFYKDIYEIDNERIYNRYYNYEEMHKPLDLSQYSAKMNENLEFLMTPFSGIEYGYSGGIAGALFTNRGLYLNEKGEINPDICKTLMHSKNPAVRLMAIEHYLKNTSEFNNNQPIVDWIETVYNELPTIETMEGCLVMNRNSRDLVEEYVKRKN